MEQIYKHIFPRRQRNSAGTEYAVLVANSNCVGTTARLFSEKVSKLKKKFTDGTVNF